ncbi:Kinase [Hexamita inflata]|uniref:Kinase n=1 Tax=Hexamita inflata TaxID=28002 RepID=A0ABP1JFJ9_9EUKA
MNQGMLRPNASFQNMNRPPDGIRSNKSCGNIGPIDSDGYFTCGPGEVVNGYTMVRLLGQGTFGRVLEATKNNQSFAVKISRQGDQFLSACEHELDILNKLSHTNVSPKLHDQFQLYGCVFMVMEFCEQNFQDYLAQFRSGLPFRLFTQVATRLAHLLHTLHLLHIVHADFKPANIMLLRYNDLSSLCLIDFGSANSSADLEHYIQSRWFRAPEVLFKKRPYTSKIDSWGLGCVLFFARKRVHLFEASSEHMLCRQMIGILKMPSHFNSTFFVKNTFQFLFQNKKELEELEIDKNAPFFPNSGVLKAVGRPQCDARDWKVELQNVELDEGDEEEEIIMKIIKGLIQWEPEERFDVKKVLDILE